MEAIIRHAGISTLSLIGGVAVTAAAAINPIGAGLFVAGFVMWLNQRER